MNSGFRTYVGNIYRALSTTFAGLAVTASWMFRKPSTIQYPFAPSAPQTKLGGPDTLPKRYRGILEVDMDLCTACKLCEQACPIDCIRIDIEKVALPNDPTGTPVRAMTRFDIDMGKCMYCGLCVEPCPTFCLRHTTEFEASTAHIENLVARFVKPGEPAVPYKVKKDDPFEGAAHGEIAKGLFPSQEWDKQNELPLTEAKNGLPRDSRR